MKLVILDCLIVILIGSVTVFGQAMAIGSGKQHTFIVHPNTMPVGCGQNTSGQLGVGVAPAIPAPTQIPWQFGFIAVTGGTSHSLALDTSGRLWAWGLNSSGQLGNGTTTNATTPALVPSLLGVISMATHSDWNVVALADGSTWAWGSNAFGQLGNGTTQSSSLPTPLASLVNIVQVAAGERHGLALRDDGTVWAWGWNFFGQLGIGSSGSSAPSLTPVQVPGLSGILAVACGDQFSMALRNDGTVWSWGLNGGGQLGIGTNANTNTPTQIPGFAGVMTIACGSSHALAIKSDGSTWAWGSNGFGQLGRGSLVSSNVPGPVVGINDGVAIAGGNQHSVVLRASHEVWTFGANTQGQLGNLTTLLSTLPIKMSLPYYPNEGGDVRLLSGVNATPTTGLNLDIKTAHPNDIVVVRVESPGQTLASNPFALVMQLFATGSTPSGPGHYPEVFLNPQQFVDLTPIIGVGTLTPILGTAGSQLSLLVPPSVIGFSALFQAASLTNSAPNGFFVATEGHEIRFT